MVDARGVASTGTVTRIDLGTLAATNTIGVGLHPTAIVWDEPDERLYVANGNSDSVSVIDTRRMAVAQTFAIAPFAVEEAGIAPTALALSKDRATLYAACGGINAIAVLDARTGAVRGLIPTAWYPNGLSISPDGAWIAVSALLATGLATPPFYGVAFTGDGSFTMNPQDGGTRRASASPSRIAER